MKRMILAAMAVVLLGSAMTTQSYAGDGKLDGIDLMGFNDGVEVENLNEWTDPNEVAIRVWVLTEEQAQNPPTTRAEADALWPAFITYPGVTAATSDRNASGTRKVIVAADEALYQSLSSDDPFTIDEDYSTLVVTVTPGSGYVPVRVRDAADSSSPPEIFVEAPSRE